MGIYPYYNKNTYSLFTFQFTKGTINDGEENRENIPKKFGVYYQRYIEEGTGIGLVADPEDNFNYLTYLTLPIRGEVEVSFPNCTSYPEVVLIIISLKS